jgi:hypothetical protein
MTIYEQYGRLAEQYQQECESHAQTVNVLRRLKQGEITLDSLTVTDENRWSILPMPEVVDEAPAN